MLESMGNILIPWVKESKYLRSIYAFWEPKKNNLKLMELSSLNKVSLVLVSSCNNTRFIRDDAY